MTNSAIQNEEDSINRGAASWKEALFLEQNSPEGEFHYPYFKKKDECHVYDILVNFKNQKMGNIHL